MEIYQKGAVLKKYRKKTTIKIDHDSHRETIINHINPFNVNVWMMEKQFDEDWKLFSFKNYNKEGVLTSHGTRITSWAKSSCMLTIIEIPADDFQVGLDSMLVCRKYDEQDNPVKKSITSYRGASILTTIYEFNNTYDSQNQLLSTNMSAYHSPSQEAHAKISLSYKSKNNQEFITKDEIIYGNKKIFENKYFYEKTFENDQLITFIESTPRYKLSKTTYGYEDSLLIEKVKKDYVGDKKTKYIYKYYGL